MPRVFVLIAVVSWLCIAQEPITEINPEETAFTEAGREKEPQKKVELWDAFLKEFPQSKRADTARRELVQAQFKLDPAAAEARVKEFEEGMGRFSSAAYWRVLANAYLTEAKQLDKAEDAARRALKNYTFDGYLTDARKTSEANKRSMPSEGRMRFSFNSTRIAMLEILGEACAKQNKDGDAEKALREALELNSTASKAALVLAGILDKRGQTAEALPLAAQGLLAKPSKEARATFEALYAKARPDAKDAEAYLDATYKRVFPEPIHTEPYKKTGKRSDRVVFAEVYTGAGCPPCVAADLAFDAVLERFSRSDVAVVMFHEHIPKPDPLTNSDTVARWKWLKGRGVPTYNIDGLDGGGGGPREHAAELEEKNREIIEKRLEVPADAKLSLTAEHKGSEVVVRAGASDLKKQSPDLVLHVALAEKLIRYSGENGIRFHPMVVRSHAQFALESEPAKTKEYTFDLAQVSAALKQHLDDFEKHDERHNKDGNFRFMARPEMMDAANLVVVAWLEDDKTREVYQAAFADAPVKRQ